MPSLLKMPRLSDTMTEGVLVRWNKVEGDTIEPGDILAEVETDKATMELEAFEPGVLRQILLRPGQAIPVGGNIAILAENLEEDIAGLIAGGTSSSPTSTTPPTGSSASAMVASSVGENGDHTETRLKASPLARKMADQNQLNLQAIEGSGPGGRIIRRDIERTLQRVPARVSDTLPEPVADVGSASGQRLPLSTMRKTIARRMTDAKQTIPHFYLTMEIDMDAALEIREHLNRAAAGDVKISVNDLILKGCALSLLRHPKVNASFDGDAIIINDGVHMGFAAAVEDGLLTPVVRDCQRKSIGAIAKESRDLAERAVAKKLRPDEMTGATFTVSNLGMFGITEFSAIINPPQAAILAIGAVRELAVVRAGQLVVGKRMMATLSCDHRVIDGAAGAQFLGTLKEMLENPYKLFL